MRRGGRDDFFRHPFGDLFGGDPFGGMPSMFGGRDPFSDPFFTQPMSTMMGPNMFGPMFGPNMNPFGNFGFMQQQGVPPPQQLPPNRSQGPIIQELDTDEDEEVVEERKNNRKHSRPSKEPYVHEPDDDEEVEGKKSRYMQQPKGEFNRARALQPQYQTFSFQSSTTSYSGPDGPYYTASTTRRMGPDGVVMEESKEADTATGKATHRISKGIHDKGHSLTRKLNSDGRVDSVQTLHNLNPDELPDFNEDWKGKAQRHLPGWNQNLDRLGDVSITGTNVGSSSSGQRRLALPASEKPRAPVRVRPQFHQTGSSAKRQ